MRKPTLFFTGLAAGALALAGCTAGATDAADDATSTGSSAGTTVVTEEATTVSASTDALTEVSYEELGVKDVGSVDETGAVAIALSDSGSTGGDGVSVDGSTVTITAGGTYVLAGTLSSGQVVVDTADEDVTLILDGVDVTSDGIAALDIEGADEVVVWLAEGSTNALASADDAAATSEDETDVPDATLYSTANLWIAGTGALTVDGSPEDGITSKDGLVIQGGTIAVTAADDGIRGKDHLVIEGGSVTVDAGGDGLRSDNEDIANDDGEAVGVVWISDGSVDVQAGSDAIEGFRQVAVAGGDLELAAGDDGITTDGVLHISAGTVDVTTSYEGLEGGVVLLSGGDGTLVSTDDGINVSGGSGSGGAMGDAGGMDGTDGTRPERGAGGPGGSAASDTAASETTSTTATSTTTASVTTASVTTASATTDATVQTVAGGMGGMGQVEEGRYLEISGGTWYLDAGGDGLDSNGTASMTGGTVVVDGPTSNGNGPIDVNGTFTISGGTLAASGSSGMLEAPTASGDQGVLTVVFASAISEGTVITVTDADGDHVASFTPAKTTQSVVLSTVDIVAGETYTVSVDGTVSGDGVGGLVLAGTVSGGEELGTLTAD